MNLPGRPSGAALEAEVNSGGAEWADQRDESGRRLVVRNGYHQTRKVATAAGVIEVKAPRINDKRVNEAAGERRRFSKGAVSRATALAMVFKLVESAQARRRAVNAPHLVALVRAGARLARGQLLERSQTTAT